MKRGPQPNARADANASYADKARAAWGDAIPEWVIVLAEVADVRGQKGAAEAIGYSNSLVSSVISNSYSGSLAQVAGKVAGALMGETVDCPRKGEMARDVCLDWQAKPKATTSPDRSRMYQACRSGCPHSRIKGGSDADQ